MGKWDCCVVLRRELLKDVNTVSQSGRDVVNTNNNSHNNKEGYKWNIGLVPSHTITHPRLIGYYEAREVVGREIPVNGWRVVGSWKKKVGGLKILYED